MVRIFPGVPYSYTQTEGRDARETLLNGIQLDLEADSSPSSMPLGSYASGDIPHSYRSIDGRPVLRV